MLRRPGGRAAVLMLLVGLSPSACREPAGSTSSEVLVSEADSADVRVRTLSGTLEGLPEWALSEIPLTEISGDAPPYLGSVGAVAFLGSDRLLVYDRQSSVLRIFGSDGEVVGVVAEAGDGPGELRAVVELTVTQGDTTFAFDRRHSRMSVFGPDGRFARAVSFDPQVAGPGLPLEDAWPAGPGLFLVASAHRGEADVGGGEPRRVAQERILQMVSADGAPVTRPVTVDGGFSVQGPLGQIGSPFSNRPFVAVSRDRIVFGSGRTYEIVVRDARLRPRMVIRWPDWPRTPTTSVLDAVRPPMDASLSDLRSVNPEAADDLIETLFHSDALPDVLPALGSVLLDEDGRIWVSRFRPTVDLGVATTGGYEPWSQEDVWHVLSADGIPVARVRLPSDTRLLAVREDRVAVVTRDSLGVESVRVLAIEAGEGPH